MYWPARRNFLGLSWPLPPFSVAGRILPESSNVAPDSVVEMEVQSLEKSLAEANGGEAEGMGDPKRGHPLPVQEDA